MCGIAGIAFNRRAFESLEEMTNALSTRGPDSSGFWSDDTVALGHRRLAILDLSEAGHQPMLSSSGRFVLSYNGEVYNFLDLRKDLEFLGYQFRGHSDTEIALAAFEAWGIEAALQKFNGMFALALWDRQQKCLYLARDRFGEKPLYYGIVNGALVFGSELKALRCYPGFKRQINTEAVQHLLRYSYIQAPLSIYQGIFKLTSGCYLKVRQDLQLNPETYWSASDMALAEKDKTNGASEVELLDELETLLIKSVKDRCISDVPLGAFLSGGIDSTMIAALMQKVQAKPIMTFSIGFNQKAYNEAPFAKTLAKYLKTEHHELYISDKDAFNLIPRLSEIYDEPFADSSQIPTYLVSQFAKKKVTVALSGDAGDELFGGYTRYFFYKRLSKFCALPNIIKHPIANLLDIFPWGAVGLDAWNDKVRKLAYILRVRLLSAYEICTNLNDQANLYLAKDRQEYLQNNFYRERLSEIENAMLWDTENYLPGDILTKVDRASMAVSLETRVPFLDVEVFKFAWRLPLEYKIREGSGKYLLKQLLYKYVPKELVDRPKAGFGIPINDWLRGPLKLWMCDLLTAKNIAAQGYLDAHMVRKALDEHLSGKRNHGHLLWNILIFQEWINQN